MLNFQHAHGVAVFHPPSLRMRERIAAAFKGARTAARLVSASCKSLDDFLKKVWQERETIGTGRGQKRVYSLYREAQEPNRLTITLSAYRGKLVKVEREREAGKSFFSEGFLHFDRSGFNSRNQAHLATIQERVYLNVDADRAPDVINKVVKEIIDKPNDFPGVPKAKIDVEKVGERPDLIVIYAQSKEAAEKDLEKVKQYQSQNPAHFKTSTPRMTEPVAPGVSIGAEPPGSVGQTSFGLLRSLAIEKALGEAMQHQETEEQFVQRVLEHFRRNGIDPENPYRNLPPGGGQ